MLLNRKPHNVIEGPVAPFIQRDPVRFQNAGKHWTVNTADIIRDTEDQDFLLGNSVLAVARDENQTRYGQRSYIPKVNKNFRPPIIDPYRDKVALSRQPRPTTQVRINHEAPYKEQNMRDEQGNSRDVSHFIDEKVLLANVRPTYTIKLEVPLDDTISHNFRIEDKVPQVNGYSGMNTPIEIDSEYNRYDLYRDYKNPQTSITPDQNFNVSHNYTSSQTTPLEDLELDYNNPQVKVNAGFTNIPYNQQMTHIEDIDLEYNMPQVSARSNKTTNYDLADHTTPLEDLQLNYNRPNASVYNAPYKLIDNTDYDVHSKKLQDNISISYTPMANCQIREENINREPELKWTMALDNNAYGNDYKTSSAIPKAYSVENQTPKLRSKMRVQPDYYSV
jgi:hypothetical protein